MTALVDIRSDHDHYLRPFVGCHLRTDLRWTNLSRGEATLLSSHARDPRVAAGAPTDVGQTSRSPASLRVSPPPTREPTRSVGHHRPATQTMTLMAAYQADE